MTNTVTRVGLGIPTSTMGTKFSNNRLGQRKSQNYESTEMKEPSSEKQMLYRVEGWYKLPPPQKTEHVDAQKSRIFYRW